MAEIGLTIFKFAHPRLVRGMFILNTDKKIENFSEDIFRQAMKPNRGNTLCIARFG
jgi:hypothetical protein